MDTKKRRSLKERLLVLLLAFTVTAAFMPLLGDSAYAVDSTESNSDLVQVEGQPAADDASDTDTIGITDVSEYVENKSEHSEDDAAIDENSDVLSSDAPALSPKGSINTKASTNPLDYVTVFNFTPDYSAGTVHIDLGVKGSYYIGDIYIFDFSYSKPTNIQKVASGGSQQSYSGDISMSVASVGSHYFYFAMLDRSGKEVADPGTTGPVYFDYITDNPGTGGSFDVYWNFFRYTRMVDPGLINYRMYMEYAPAGGLWTTYNQAMTYAVTYTVGALKPNTKYSIRFYYGKETNHGFVKGPYSSTLTIKTGKSKKPPVKSVTVKATKVKRHKVRRYGYYTGVYLGSYYYYTYNLKITVKMKKKPGTAGVWIMSHRKAGNKKKYTVTIKGLSSYKKPRGQKYKVLVYSYQNKGYGGYSPIYYKTKKIK